MMIVWVLVVLIVIVGLVFITIKVKKGKVAPVVQEEVGQVEQNTNMQNTTQPEGVSQAPETPTSTDGVKVTILKEGMGQVAKSGDTVAMNYTGKLLDGTTFDSNVDPKFSHVQPFVFTIGAQQVIKGWDVGVAGMKVGEKRKLELAPEFAYGATGAGNIIPPNATLVFEVELLGIKK